MKRPMIVAIYSDGHLLPMDVDHPRPTDDVTLGVEARTEAHRHSRNCLKTTCPVAAELLEQAYKDIQAAKDASDRHDDDGGEMPSPAWLESRRRK